MALSQIQIFHADALPVAVQNRHAPFRAPLRLARITGVEKQHTVQGFAEALVRMAEHHHVRPFAREALLQGFIQFMRPDDVLDEKFPAGEFDGF